MTRDDTDRLLPTVKRRLTEWTAFTWPERSRILRDADGTPYAYLTHDATGRPYACAAKRALHHGTHASFMPRLVKQAATADAILCLFVGADPALGSAYAFAPERVTEWGQARRVDSKRRGGVTILDVDVEAHAVCLGDVVSGRSEPPRGSERVEYDGTLEAFGVRS